MSGILGELAKGSALVGIAVTAGVVYFIAPIGVRALDLGYYYTLGGALTMNNATLFYTGLSAAGYAYMKRDQLQQLKL